MNAIPTYEQLADEWKPATPTQELYVDQILQAYGNEDPHKLNLAVGGLIRLQAYGNAKTPAEKLKEADKWKPTSKSAI